MLFRKVFFRVFLLGLGVAMLALSGCQSFVRPIPKHTFAPIKSDATQAPAKILYWHQEEVYEPSFFAGFSVASKKYVTQRIQFLKKSGFVHATKIIQNGLLDSLYIRTQCPDGSVHEMHKKDVQQVAKGIFSSSNNHLVIWNYKFTAPGVSVGCVTDFHYIVFLAKDQAEVQLPLMHDLPIKRAKFTFRNLTSRAFFSPTFRGLGRLWWRLAHSSKMPSPQTAFHLLPEAKQLEHLREHVSYKPGAILSISLGDIPGHTPLTPSPKASFLLPKVYQQTPEALLTTLSWSQLKESVTWQAIDLGFFRKYYLLDERSKELMGQLPAIAKRLVKGVYKRKDKIRILYQHIHSHFKISLQKKLQKAPIWKSYQERFGNAYAVTMSLLIMLRAARIPAYPALLIPEQGVQRSRSPLPSLYQEQFLYIAPEKEGDWLGLLKEYAKQRKQKTLFSSKGMLLKPSVKELSVGKLPTHVYGKRLLVFDGLGGRIHQVPQLSWKQNRRAIRLSLTLQEKGGITGELHVQSSGQLGTEDRRSHQRKVKKKKSKGSDWVHRICGPKAKLISSKSLSDKNKSDHFAYKLSFQGAFCLFSYGDKRLLLQPIPAKLFALPFLPKDGKIKRKAPIALGTLRQLSWQLDYQLPPSYRFEKVKEWSKSIPGVQAQLSIHHKKGGRLIRVKVSFQVTRHVLPASAYPKLRGFLVAFRRQLQHPIQLVQGGQGQ